MKSDKRGTPVFVTGAVAILWTTMVMTLLASSPQQLCVAETSSGSSSSCSPNSLCSAWAAYRAMSRLDLPELASLFNVSEASIKHENGSQFMQPLAGPNFVSVHTIVRIPLTTCRCVGDSQEFDNTEEGGGASDGREEENDPSSLSGMVATLSYWNDIGVTCEGVANLFGNLVRPEQIAHVNKARREEKRDSWEVAVPCKCGSAGGNMGGDEDGVWSPLQFATYVAHTQTSVNKLALTYNSTELQIRQHNRHVKGTYITVNQTIFIPLDVPQVGSTGAVRPIEAETSPRTKAGHDDYSRNRGPQTAIAVLVVGAIVGFLAILLLLFVGVLALNGRKGKSAGGPERHDSFDICCHLVKSSDCDKDKDEKDPKTAEGESASHGGIDLRPADTEKSRIFFFKELSAATNNFSDRNKIGDGGYCTVYRGLLNGKPRAIKKMLGSANREFQLELQVLTKVHHIHLVELVGHCIENGLYLVYDYMPNGTLSQHLHNPASYGFKPLRWCERVQIALDSARALEYIHEHTTPRYVHRDIKSNNILLDKNLRAKVADFGLTKLIRENSDGNSQTRLVGTFGYMAPEYARFGEISTKVDVYAFGVVLLELVSGKEAIVQRDATGMNGTIISLLAPVWREPCGIDRLPALIDPAVRDMVSLEDVYKLVILAGKCTDEDPEARPSMRTVVMALMTLSSLSTEWEAGFDADITFAALLNGR